MNYTEVAQMLADILTQRTSTNILELRPGTMLRDRFFLSPESIMGY